MDGMTRAATELYLIGRLCGTPSKHGRASNVGVRAFRGLVA